EKVGHSILLRALGASPGVEGDEEGDGAGALDCDAMERQTVGEDFCGDCRQDLERYTGHSETPAGTGDPATNAVRRTVRSCRRAHANPIAEGCFAGARRRSTASLEPPHAQLRFTAPEPQAAR